MVKSQRKGQVRAVEHKRELTIAIVGNLLKMEGNEKVSSKKSFDILFYDGLKVAMSEYVGQELIKIRVLFTANQSDAKAYPQSLGAALDAVKAQELLIAKKADLTVYINDGGWSEAKRRFLDRLLEVAGSLIVWTPFGVEEDEPEGSVSESKPGLVLGNGPIHLLAQLILFVGMPSDEFVFQAEK